MSEETTTKLTAVTTYAAQVDLRKKAIAEVHADLDKAVLEAKLAGAKYREIAVASGRSVAWVQAILNKMSYTGPRKAKRAAAKAAEAEAEAATA